MVVKDEPRLPQFLIVGAVKAATTWLAHQLGQSSGIFIPQSEPHFFTREYDRGLEWYERFFAGAGRGQLVGEKTADYLVQPVAPARVAQLIPGARLVAQLRNPVDRAYSDYCMLFRRGSVSRDIQSYLDPDRAEFRRFLDGGLYHDSLVRWFDHFEREQLLILLFEDSAGRPRQTVHDVARHIGLAPELVPEATAERVKDSRAGHLPLGLRQMLAPAKRIVRPFRGEKWFETARSLLARPISYPPLTPELRLRLDDFYAKDVEKLERLVGRSLASWKVGVREAAKEARNPVKLRVPLDR
jgi:hypothetical protein